MGTRLSQPSVWGRSCPLLYRLRCSVLAPLQRLRSLTAAILSAQVRRRRRRSLAFAELLEDRTLLAAAFPEFVDPNPNPGNQFGASVVPLSTGNVVVTSPYDDAGGVDAGAVYLFDGATGALISTLIGSSANDNVGGGGVT